MNSIPDDAVAVGSMNPMQLHRKGKVNSLETLKERAKDEIWEQIIEDPLSTGLNLDEYTFVFVIMEDEAPVIGVLSEMKNTDKFVSTLERIKENIASEFREMDKYTYTQPDEAGVISWNSEKMILLTSPDHEDFETTYWTEKLDRLYNPVKEESITSMVDFRDFFGKMKDLNLWLSADDMRAVMERVIPDTVQFDLPLELYNNYAHIYCEFSEGAMYVNGETRLSEEVEKNVEQFLVMKPSLNEDMLKLAPGGDLLLGLSGSMDLSRLRNMAKRFSPPKLDQMGNKIELATGIPAEELLDAFTGDFTIAVNGIEEETMIPLEIFLGMGVNNELIQEKLMDNVHNMAKVEEEGDFFVINIQGTEIYSGILNDIWVITNAKGYKDAAGSGKLDKSLLDSKFNDFSDGSVGMYLNLDMSQYPALIQGALSEKPQQRRWMEQLTESFNYLGISAGNYASKMTLETNKPNENSLYTILKMTEVPD